MVVFFWIVDLLIPLAMVLIGTLFSLRPPRRINMIYGYRTPRSMASQEAWDLAHRLCGKAWMTVGSAVFLFIVLDKLVIPVQPEYLSLVNLGLSIAAMVTPIPFIEKRLKERFGK